MKNGNPFIVYTNDEKLSDNLDGMLADLDRRISAIEDAVGDLDEIDARLDSIEADSWVTSGRIADGAVTTLKIDDEAVTTDKVANDAITGSKIAPFKDW